MPETLKRILTSKYFFFPYILLILVLLLSAFKINGSSVGMYHQLIYGGEKNSNLLLGEPRPIRSDEWAVETPLIASQAKNGLQHTNTLIGSGEEVSLIYSSPSNHWINLFRPQNMAFYVLPFENAYAFRWWIRGAFLMLATYLLLLVITRKDIFLSVCGALIMFFTPFIQWWYSVMAVESLSYFFFILFFLTQVLKRSSLSRRIIFTIFLSYFTICFALILYPPFQIPLVILGVLFALGYSLQNKYFFERKYLLHIALCGVLFAVLVGSVLALFYLDFKDLIHTISSTSYPGQRIIKGGNFSHFVLLSGVFGYLLQKKYVQVPSILSNQSEAATFFFVSLFTVPVMLYSIIKRYLTEKRIDYIFIVLLAYFGICMLWFFGGLTGILGKVLFLKLVQESRLIIGLGAASFIGAFYFITNVDIKQIARNIDYRIAALVISFITFLTYFYVGYFYKVNFPSFISSTKTIVLIALIASGITLFLLWSKERLFALSLIAFSIFSALTVNPLYIGLKPLINSDLSQKLTAIEDSNEGKDSWAIFDNGIYGEYLVANGIRSVDSTHLYPLFPLWNTLDPDSSHKEYYNRYAHVMFLPIKDEEKIEYYNPAGDTVFVSISPCNKKFDSLKVNFFVFAEEVNYGCIRKKETLEYPTQKWYVYERNELIRN